MFAIVIYDLISNIIILSRDQMGIKPLFYYYNEHHFLFASEIKSLKSHPSFQNDLNFQAIADYLSYQFVPKPQTVYKNIFGLPSGSTLTLTGNKYEIEKYWDIDVTSQDDRLDEDELARNTLKLLRISVERHLLADVECGILLSGGIDSSAIAALAAELTPQPINTFSIVFREKTFDESYYSRLMARYLNSCHHEVVLDSETILNSMDKIAYYFDEPFCEGSAFPIYHICQYAQNYITVILSGEGSDELFGGYEVYKAQKYARYYKLLPDIVRRLLGLLINQLPVSDNKVSLDLKLRRFIDGALFNPPKAHFWWRASMNDAEKGQILSADFLNTLERQTSSDLYEHLFYSLNSSDILNKIMASDCNIHLVDDLLIRADRMSMAHTMELRIPYLDIDVVNFAFSIPSKYKINGFFDKVPLRQALKSKLPEEIRLRSKKALNMPYQKWFKTKRWQTLLHDTLAKSSIESLGIFNYDGIYNMLTNHQSGKQNNAHALWALLNLILWLQKNKT